MDPIVGGAILGGAANLIGDLFSESNARDAFQHRYQDTVADMRKAGLNPALAYGQGGGNPQTVPIGDIGSSAAQAAQAFSQAKQSKANTDLTQAQADLLKAQRDDLVQTTAFQRMRANFEQQNADTRGKMMAIDYGRKQDLNPEFYSKYRAEAALAQMRIPHAKAYADYYKSPVGRAEPYIGTATDVAKTIAQFMKSGKAVNSFPRRR